MTKEFTSWHIPKISPLLNIGIHSSLSPLSSIRGQLINVSNFIFLSAVMVLFIYRVFVSDWHSVLVNFVLLLTLCFSVSLCKKGKHQSSILLIIVLFYFLNIDLYFGKYYQSILVYITLLPLFMAIVLERKIIKHLIFLSCVVFFLFHKSLEDLNLFITYNAVMSGCYLGVIKFVDFLEHNQQLLNTSIQEKTEAIKALQLKNKELHQFSYICSHDLKEPILTIGTYVNLVNKKFEQESLSNDYSNLFYFINNGVTKLSNLLEQIRIYFDIEEDKKLVLETLNIIDVFRVIKQDLPILKQKGNVSLVLKNQMDSQYLFCSKSGLSLLLKNLIHNAVQFNSTPQAVVEVSFEKQNGQVLISVVDNGIGIKENDFNYIFEPFKTLASKNIYNSSGLGLAICKKIVTALEGKIWLESTPNKGSTFYVSFTEKPTEM